MTHKSMQQKRHILGMQPESDLHKDRHFKMTLMFWVEKMSLK